MFKAKAAPEALHEERTIYEMAAAGGVFLAAMTLSHAMLGTGDDLHASPGLTSALLDHEQEMEAQTSDTQNSITRLTKPRLDVRYDFYSDSDGNSSDKYTSMLAAGVRNWDLAAGYKYIKARAPALTQTAEEVFGKATRKITDSLTIGGRIGFDRLGKEQSTFVATGQLTLDATLANSTVNLSVARDALTATAELIDNKIRTTQGRLSLLQPLTERLRLQGTYIYRDFSDRNHADDFQGVFQYRMYGKTPQIDLSYGLRYLNFERQSHHGYFDPEDFFSHQVTCTVYFEWGPAYGYLEAAFGHQSFRRNLRDNRDFFGTGIGTVGVKPTRSLLLELTAEGGNYALGTTAGFIYYALGARLGYLF